MTIDEFLNEGPRTFRTRWLGYDRAEVDEEYARMEGLLATTCADRDAVFATAEDLARHLEEARSELAEYRMIHAGHSKDDVMSGCIRYLLHTAKKRAEEMETEARTRTDEAVRQAEEAASRQARLLDETEQETQRRLAEASRRAKEVVGEALEQSRTILAELAERQRLLDQWYSEISTSPDLPLPRAAEPADAEPAEAAEAAEAASVVAEPAQTGSVESGSVESGSVESGTLATEIVATEIVEIEPARTGSEQVHAPEPSVAR